MPTDEVKVCFAEDAGDYVDNHVVAKLIDDGKVFLVVRIGKRDTDAVNQLFLDVAEKLFAVLLQMTLVHRQVGDDMAFLEQAKHPFQVRMRQCIAATDSRLGAREQRTEHGFHTTYITMLAAG